MLTIVYYYPTAKYDNSCCLTQLRVITHVPSTSLGSGKKMSTAMPFGLQHPTP